MILCCKQIIIKYKWTCQQVRSHECWKKRNQKQQTVIHNSGSDIFSRDALCPGSLNVQVKLGFSPVLAGVFEVPLILKVGICGISTRRVGFRIFQLVEQWHQLFHAQRLVASLYPLEARLLNCCVDLQT